MWSVRPIQVLTDRVRERSWQIQQTLVIPAQRTQEKEREGEG